MQLRMTMSSAMNFSIAFSISTNFLNLTISKELLNKLRGWREKERNKRKINPEKKKHELVRQRTYRKEERFLGQAFCVEDRLEFGWEFGWTKEICARILKCKSEETNQFQKSFIPPIESNCTNFPAYKGKEISTVRSPSRRWTWEVQSRPHLMKTCFTFQRLQERVSGRRRVSGTDRWQGLTSFDRGLMSSKPSYPSENPDSRILRGYCEARELMTRPTFY